MEAGLKVLCGVVALALAACHAPAATSKGAPPPAAQGPVNPYAGVTAYRCVDGSSINIEAGYPDHDTAVVKYKDHAYTLKRAPSATGDRYTGYGLQWTIKGANASVAALKPNSDSAVEPGLACAAVQDGPAANPITRTTFRPSSP